MLVWGGEPAGEGPRGGAYDLATDAWSPLPAAGAPSARTGFSAVWTGTELLIWGGFAPSLPSAGAGDGAAYNPATRTWRPLPNAGAPSRRGQALAVWTGGAMVIWGGESGKDVPLGDGAAYLPAANAWRPLPTAGAPSPRIAPTGVWTGSQLLVWGGSTPFLDPYADGARFLPPTPEVHPARCYAQTGFCIDNDTIGDYFQRRGGLATFGYPTSRTFTLQGFTVQFFQRKIVQVDSAGHARLLNLLDSGLMPYTRFNGSAFPGVDSGLVATAPSPTDQPATLAWVKAHAPNSVNGAPTNYDATFRNTVTAAAAFPNGGDASLLPGFNLEMWGVPTSNAIVDPNNHNFVYLRWQRGIMHYDATCNCTQGVLLADYFKDILTGQNLPADLAQESATSPFRDQYDPSKPNWVHDPSLLPNTNLTNAFTPE